MDFDLLSDILIKDESKSIQNWLKSIENGLKFIKSILKLIDFNRILAMSLNQSPISTLKSESSNNCHPNLLEFDFKLSTIRFMSPNRLSLMNISWMFEWSSRKSKDI